MNRNKKKILVVGGSGFIGINLIKKLDKNKNYVSATYFKKKKFKRIKNVNYFKGDLKDFNFCKKITKSADIVFMCAAVSSGAKDIQNDPMMHVDENVMINLNIIKAASLNSVKKFIFLSSNVVYPNSKKPMSEENMNYSLFNKYFYVGWMKIFSEKVCEMYKDKIQILIVRPSNLYGPFDKFDKKKSKVIPSLIDKFKLKNKIKVWGEGKDIKDFMFIEDFIDALILVVNRYKKFTIMNIASGKSIKLEKIINFLKKYHNKDNIIYDTTKPTMIPVRKIDIKKLKNFIKFKPKFTIEKGLEKTIKWRSIN